VSGVVDDGEDVDCELDDPGVVDWLLGVLVLWAATHTADSSRIAVIR
jgi:hypothetical protein